MRFSGKIAVVAQSEHLAQYTVLAPLLVEEGERMFWHPGDFRPVCRRFPIDALLGKPLAGSSRTLSPNIGRQHFPFGLIHHGEYVRKFENKLGSRWENPTPGSFRSGRRHRIVPTLCAIEISIDSKF
jgi:hypothetical protein